MRKKESLPAPLDKEEILYQGKTFEVIKKFWKVGKRTTEREIARRSPGVGVIARERNKILLIKEYRSEYGGWDWRLPGGKVFDTFGECKKIPEKEILKHAFLAAKKELLEETGLIAKETRHLCSTKAGATVEWDMHYFEATEFEKAKAGPECGEIIRPARKSLEQAGKMCLDGRIREDRTVGVLLRYINGL